MHFFLPAFILCSPVVFFFCIIFAVSSNCRCKFRLQLFWSITSSIELRLRRSKTRWTTRRLSFPTRLESSKTELPPRSKNSWRPSSKIDARTQKQSCFFKISPKGFKHTIFRKNPGCFLKNFRFSAFSKAQKKLKISCYLLSSF